MVSRRHAVIFVCNSLDEALVTVVANLAPVSVFPTVVLKEHPQNANCGDVFYREATCRYLEGRLAPKARARRWAPGDQEFGRLVGTFSGPAPEM